MPKWIPFIFRMSAESQELKPEHKNDTSYVQMKKNQKLPGSTVMKPPVS